MLQHIVKNYLQVSSSVDLVVYSYCAGAEVLQQVINTKQVLMTFRPECHQIMERNAQLKNVFQRSLQKSPNFQHLQHRQLSCTTYFIFVNCNHYDVGIHNRNLQNPLKKKIYAACTIIIITLVVYLLFLHIYECYAKNPIVYKWVHYILP